MDETYDAYEKDIAMVSIFFKRDTVHEFKRYIMNRLAEILTSKTEKHIFNVGN